VPLEWSHAYRVPEFEHHGHMRVPTEANLCFLKCEAVAGIGDRSDVWPLFAGIETVMHQREAIHNEALLQLLQVPEMLCVELLARPQDPRGSKLR